MVQVHMRYNCLLIIVCKVCKCVKYNDINNLANTLLHLFEQHRTISTTYELCRLGVCRAPRGFAERLEGLPGQLGESVGQRAHQISFHYPSNCRSFSQISTSCAYPIPKHN